MDKKVKKEDIIALKLVSDTSRLSILKLILWSKKELCVNEIAQAVGLTQSATSHQLSKLDDSGVIFGKRIGQTICYKPKDNLITQKIIKIIKSLS